MRVVSLNIGRPALVSAGGRQYSTAINRRPVDEPVALTTLGFAGDRVANAESHGGPDKAVCCYPYEHYGHWADVMRRDMPVPSFGENLTTEGLLENAVCIGDTYRVGSAVVQVSQPRQPCFKLAARNNEPRLPAWINEKLWSGFYVRVLAEGEVRTGDAITLEERLHPELTVAAVMHTRITPGADDAALARLADLPDLAHSWREHFRNGR